MNHTRKAGFVALALLMTLVLVSQAFAEVKINLGAGGASATSSMKWKIDNTPFLFMNEPLFNPGTGQTAHYVVGPVDNANKAVGRAVYGGPGTTASAQEWITGNVQWLGTGVSSAPDTAYASIGLYQAPGGTNLGSNPDSVLRVNITRTAGNVAITFPAINVSFASGGLQVRAVGPNETSIAEFRLVVYPNQAAANADVNADGNGSAFFGRIKLETGAGVPSQVNPISGFAPGDFALLTDGSGKYTARPIANLTKNVPVANSSDAVVVLHSIPTVHERPVTVPSSTPIGLTLLALALMASGVWVIKSRRRAEAV